MRVAVLCAADSWYFRDLLRAAGEQLQIEALSFSALRRTTGGGSPVSDALTEFDAVLVRTMPPGSLEQVVFRMDCLGQAAADGLTIVNSPRAIEIAVDKFLCSSLLDRAGLDTPRTVVCQTYEQAMEAFHTLGQNVVIKPLFGGEGRGITRVEDEAMMLRAAKMLEQLGAVHYLQEYVPHHGCDQRLLLIGSQVLGIRRCNALDWRTNISRGAKAEPLEVTDELVDLARRAAGAVQTEIAGVDILPAADGRQLVLEVNAVPGWKALATTLNTDVAAMVLDYVTNQISG